MLSEKQTLIDRKLLDYLHSTNCSDDDQWEVISSAFKDRFIPSATHDTVDTVDPAPGAILAPVFFFLTACRTGCKTLPNVLPETERLPISRHLQARKASGWTFGRLQFSSAEQTQTGTLSRDSSQLLHTKSHIPLLTLGSKSRKPSRTIL